MRQAAELVSGTEWQPQVDASAASAASAVRSKHHRSPHLSAAIVLLSFAGHTAAPRGTLPQLAACQLPTAGS
jgi:hypothetical protein